VLRLKSNNRRQELFVLTLCLQEAHHYSALRTRFAYLPLTATVMFSNVASGWLSSRWGARPCMALGALIGALGFLCLRPLAESSPYLVMLPGFVLIPTGIGLAVPAMTTAVLASLEKSWGGTASGVLNTARQVGGAIGVALFGAFLGSGQREIGSGLRASTLVAALLLMAGAGLAW
jgi:DHA2 family methylenomycin A resistance protein-like MFS transporter